VGRKEKSSFCEKMFRSLKIFKGKIPADVVDSVAEQVE
jgi:hypothetical protein